MIQAVKIGPDSQTVTGMAAPPEIPNPFNEPDWTPTTGSWYYIVNDDSIGVEVWSEDTFREEYEFVGPEAVDRLNEVRKING